MEAHSFARSDGGLALPRSRKLLTAFGDERLVAQLRRGNDVAFEVLYDRHHATVLSYCRHMLGSRDEAEDALQQTFVSAHADIMSSDKPIRFKAWVFTIARNRCLSILRARREQPSEDLDRVATEGLGEQVQQRAELRELLADMQELPDDQRSALILSELGDLSHAEVAEVIECEVAKVKSLVFQARSGLIERREARETPCEEIREQLATLRGGSLRRGPLRRHLKVCPGCTEFREDVRRQRQMVAMVLPVVPTLALKENALAAVGMGSASSGALVGGGAGAGVFAMKAGIAKVAVIAVATTGAVGGAVAVERTVHTPDNAADGGASGAGTSGKHDAAGGSAAIGGSESSAQLGGSGKASGDRREADRNGDGRLSPMEKQAAENNQGFEPVLGESNGERARDFATGRGEGNHYGIEKQQAASDGVKGNANANRRNGTKPTKENQGTQRPETAGPNNSNDSHAQPAPKPEHTLAPNLLPDLTPPRQTKPPTEERTPPSRTTETVPQP